MSLTYEDLSAYLKPQPEETPTTQDLFKSVADFGEYVGVAPSKRFEGGTRFDRNLTEGTDQSEMRGQLQPGLEKLARGFVGRTASVIPKFIQGFGHVAGFAIGAPFDNALVREMNEWDESLREDLLGMDTRVFNRRVAEEGSLARQFFTPEFWANDMFDGFAFLASALIPGGIIGKVGTAAKGAKALKLGKAIGAEMKGVKLGNAVKELGKHAGKMNPNQLKAYTKLSEGLSKLTVHGTAAYNTISEAGFEAFETGKSLREDLAVEKYGVHFEDLDMSQQQAIREEVAPRQVETFLMNAAVLAGPNYLQSKWFFGTPKTTTGLLKDAFLKGDLKADDVAQALGKTYVGSLGKNVGKKVLAGIGSEGIWEEGIQTAIQNYESRKGMNLTDENLLTGVIKEYINGFMVKDSQKAMLIGGVIGSASGVFGGIREYQYKKDELKGKEDFYKKMITDMDNIRKGYSSDLSRFVKKVDPETGEPVYDEEAILRTAMNGVNDIRNFTEATVGSIKEDNVHVGMVNREALSKLAFEHFNNSFYDNLDEAEKAIMNDLDFTAAQAENPEHVKKTAESHKAAVKELRKIYEQVEGSIPTMEDVVFDKDGTFKEDAERSDFLDMVRANMYYEGVKAQYLTEASKNVRDEYKPGFESVVKDANDRIALLENPTERTKLLKAYRESRDGLYEAKKVIENKDAKEEDKLSAQYHINKESYLMGDNAPATSRFFPGSQSLEVRSTRKIPVRNRIHATIARQQLTKSRIKDFGEKFINGEISADQLVNEVTQNFEYFTPSILREVDKLIPMVQQQYVEMNNALQDLETQIEEMENTMGVAPGKMYLQQTDLKSRKESLKTAMEGLATIGETTQGSVNEVKNMVKHFEERTLDIFEEAVYAANFTDNKGTNIPEQASKLLVQLEKTDPEDITADLTLLKKVKEEVEKQKKVFTSTGKRELLDNKVFTTELADQLESSLTTVSDLLDLSKDYVDILDQMTTLLNELEEKVRQNKGNRQVKQREAYYTESQAKFFGLGIAMDGTIRDADMVTQLKGVIGASKFDQILEEAKKDAGDSLTKNGMDGLYADLLIELYKKNSGQGSIEKLVTMIDSYKKSVVGTASTMTDNREEIIEEYVDNPEGRLRSILWGETVGEDKGIFAASSFRDPKAPAYKYDKSKSLAELIKAVESSTTLSKVSKDKALEFLDLHKTLVGKKRILDVLSSTSTISKKVGIDKAGLEDMKKSNLYPSAQQHNAIRAFVTFFSRNNIDPDDMSALAYMPGEAGTGKTTVVISRVLAHLGLKKEEILTTASNPNAISTMDSVTGSNGKPFEDVLASKLDGVKLVLVDEAGAMSDQQFDDLVKKVKEHNQGKTSKEMVKVILVGDPNQIGASIGGYPRVTDYTGEYGTITQIPPLTVPYRTDVTAITEFANEFKDNTQDVKNIYATASSSMEEFSNKTVGVHVGSRDKILELADKASKMEGTTAIIVESDKAKGAYMNKVPSTVEVLTFKEAQGRTLSRVFVDLAKSKIEEEYKGTLSPFDLNKVMYTSITRASTYAFVANNAGGFNQSVDKSLTEDRDARAQDITQNGEWFTQQIRKEEQLVNTHLKGKGEKVDEPADDTGKKDEGEDGTREGTLTEEDEDAELNKELIIDEDQYPEEDDGYEPPGVDDPPGEGLVDKGPQDHDLKYVEVDVDVTRIKPEGKVKYVRYIDSEENVRLLVMGETNSGKYIKLGEVGIQERPNLPKKLKDNIDSNTTAETQDIIRPNEEYDGSYFEAGVIADGILSFPPTSLRYIYGEEYKSGKGFLQDVMTTWKKTFRANQESFTPALKIYYEKELKDLRAKYPEFKHLKAGVPYIILTPKGNGKIQYIELRSVPLSMEADNMPELREFMDVMYEVEEIFPAEQGLKLGNASFNKAVKYFKNNFTTKKVDGKPTVVFEENKVTLEDIQQFIPDLTEEQFTKMEELSHRYIPLFFGEGKKHVRLPEQEAKDRYQDTDQDEFDFTEPDGKGYVKVLTRKKGTSKFLHVETLGLVAGLGKAQFMIADLAKRHPNFEFSDGTKVRWKRQSAKNNKEARVKSLLSEEDGNENAYRQKLKELFQKVAEGNVAAKLESLNQDLKEGKITQSLYDREVKRKNEWKSRLKFVRGEAVEKYLRKHGFEDALNDLKEEVTSSSLTLEKLEEIFTFGPDGKHPQLERNLFASKFNSMGEELQENEEVLETLVRTRFSHAIPARVRVTFPEQQVEEEGTKASTDPDVDGTQVFEEEKFYQRGDSSAMTAEEMATLPMMKGLIKRNIKDFNICY